MSAVTAAWRPRATQRGAASFEAMEVRSRRFVHGRHSGEIDFNRHVPVLEGFTTGVLETFEILCGK